MSLRFKVFLPLLLVGLLMQAYLVQIWLPNTTRDARRQYVAQLSGHLLSLTDILLLPVLDTDLPIIYRTLGTVMVDNPYWKELRLYNDKGRLLFPLDLANNASSHYFKLIRKIDYLGDAIGRLELNVDIDAALAERLEDLHRLMWIVLVAIAVFILATLGIIEFLVRRPVARLSLASDQLSSGDFNTALPAASGDEIGRLVSSFQRMRESIHDYQNKLRHQISERERAELIQSGRRRVLEKLATGASLKELLCTLTQAIEEVEPGMRCSVLLLDDSGRHLLHGAAPGLPEFYNQAIDGMEIGPEAGSCGAAAFRGQRIIAEDILCHPYWIDFRELAQKAGLRACWSEPIVSSTGRIHGTFAMYYGEPRSPTEAELELIQGAAHLAGIAIERKGTEQALNASEMRFRALYDDNPAMFFTIAADGTILSANDFAALQLQTRVPELVGSPWSALHLAVDQQVMADRLAACFKEPGSIHRWETRKLCRDGSTLRVRESTRAVTADSGALVILSVCEDFTEAHRLSEQLAYQASHDALTGLVNRREFETRLERVLNTAQHERTENALFYMDLDRFKIINDTCGHIAGDELLRQLSVVLRGQVRKRDTLARLGGDEFGLLLENCSLAKSERIAREIIKAVEEFHFVWDNATFNLGVSIGMVPITLASQNINAVLSAADNACYAAKEQGRNRLHIYHEDDAELADRYREQDWVSRINLALDRDQFELWYQPIMPLHADSTAGDAAINHFEILVRMCDAQGALILPGAFLPVAERYQLAPKIDRWVIANTFAWLQQHPTLLAQLQICSINLSGLSLGDDDFLAFVIEHLAQTGVPANKFCFEITETAAISNLTQASRFIHKLKKRGCLFALDDFGSGLSSFAYLKNLPVDFLKIDGMFVRDILDDPIDLAMVKSINDIGHVMGKKTIAEFAESSAILDKLREIGVQYAQGYGVGRPQPISRLTEFEDHPGRRPKASIAHG